MHIAGLFGVPRRTSEVAYGGVAVAAGWQPYMIAAAAGGTILTISIIMFAMVAIGTLFTKDKYEEMHAEFALPEPGGEPSPQIFERLFLWGGVALALAVAAYSGPLGEMIRNPGYLAPGMRTW